jgi:coenzyme PQQ synthesis protein D (PqqD)
MSELRLRGEDVAWREVDGELIAVDLPRSAYLGANPSGTLLWSRLAEGATRVELAQALVDTYGIDTERAHGDVDAFLRDLSSRSLLAE